MIMVDALLPQFGWSMHSRPPFSKSARIPQYKFQDTFWRLLLYRARDVEIKSETSL